MTLIRGLNIAACPPPPNYAMISIHPEPPMNERETQSALLFALTAERLSVFYEHHTWLTIAQGATLAADWLSRSKSALPVLQRKHLSTLSDQLARQISESVSREAGLHISHEMNEALDLHHASEVADSIRAECVRMLANEPM